MKYKTVWHPESPGSKVKIPDTWWNKRRQFATLGQSIRYSKYLIERHRRLV